MTTRTTSSTKKKDGRITRQERASAIQLADAVLKKVKEERGDVIHVAISDRTTIELPAHFTQEQIDARVERFKKIHKSKV